MIPSNFIILHGEICVLSSEQHTHTHKHTQTNNITKPIFKWLIVRVCLSCGIIKPILATFRCFGWSLVLLMLLLLLVSVIQTSSNHPTHTFNLNYHGNVEMLIFWLLIFLKDFRLFHFTRNKMKNTTMTKKTKTKAITIDIWYVNANICLVQFIVCIYRWNNGFFFYFEKAKRKP